MPQFNAVESIPCGVNLGQCYVAVWDRLYMNFCSFLSSWTLQDMFFHIALQKICKPYWTAVYPSNSLWGGDQNTKFNTAEILILYWLSCLSHHASCLGFEPFQYSVQFSSVSHVRLFATPWTAARQASLFITNSRSLLKPMSIKLVMPSNHLILCRPLLLLPTIHPSIRVFSNESSHQVAKVLQFQLQHQSFQWTPRTDLL